MALKINGIDGTFLVPTLRGKVYAYTKFDAQLIATNADGSSMTVDVKPKLTAVWAAVEQKARMGPCNDYFKTLNRGKSLTEILREGDIVIHMLEPKAGSGYGDIPYANTAGRDIGIDPTLLFDPQQSNLVCTLIHELAHIGGATTNASAPFEQAHAAEAALPKCGCSTQYQKTTVGSIRIVGSGRFGYA